jgi:hypothetical protein
MTKTKNLLVCCAILSMMSTSVAQNATPFAALTVSSGHINLSAELSPQSN